MVQLYMHMTLLQKKTKYFLSILAVLVIMLLSCKKEKEIDFCQMHALDQSHINNDTSDMKLLEADRDMRHEIIKNNFKELIDYARGNRFPEMGELDVTIIEIYKA